VSVLVSTLFYLFTFLNVFTSTILVSSFGFSFTILVSIEVSTFFVR